jgi:hypothetical protein
MHVFEGTVVGATGFGLHAGTAAEALHHQTTDYKCIQTKPIKN